MKRIIVSLGAVALLVAGCKPEEGIRAYDAPKDPPPGTPAVVAESASKEADVAPAGPIRWSAPAGWTEVEKAPMSYATLQASAEPRILVTISQAGGQVMANINRWEGQLGLPPSGQEELNRISSLVTRNDGQQALMVDLTGANAASAEKVQQRMLGAIIRGGQGWWFFKMMGPVEKVGELKPKFEELVKSATLAAADDAKPAEGGDGKIPGIASLTLPEGWRVDPKERPMRQGTILVGSGNEQAEIAVTRFPAAALADMQGNINRWRGQVGLPPTADANAHPAQEIAFPQGPGVLLTFDGPEGAGAGRKRLYVAMTKFPKSEQVWFFRLLGPYEVVTKNKAALDAFVKTVKFDEK